ncbi:MAG: YitT family protein [Bacteroidales bacterium]|nr:YitT family protein [Bacteroidales bacterium]
MEELVIVLRKFTSNILYICIPHNHKMKKIIETLKNWKFWKELIIMTLGMLVGAAAVNYFLVPSKIIIGSISGLSIVLAAVFEGIGISIKVSTVIVIINAILLVLAYVLIGSEFGLKTVYTALILGPLMDLWEKIYPVANFLTEPGQTSIMNDPWFDLLCFVLLLSISQSILFNINASTGGLDILGKIVNKYFHLDIGTSVSVAGIIICCSAFAINPFRMVVIGILGTFINGLCIDYFTASINKRKRVCIISSEHERIREFIIEKLQRGCSLYEVTGGYSGEKNMEIQALLTQEEFANLMAFMKDSEIKAFTTAGNVSEVYGLWHQHSRKR